MAPPQAIIFPTSPASAMGPRSADYKEKDKGVNVQVLLRCRPFNDDEVRTSAPQVVSCNEHRREVSVNLNIAAKQVDRTFTFDKVFGPQAQQQDLYEQAIVPIVNEVLEGFNCTIFAYGQTGTGKTYTMEGNGRKTKDGTMPVDAGVIPRAVQQIVDTLEAQNAEYSMKVTFLELYNEEITDLLAPEDIARALEDRQQKKPLALMEDGKGGVLVRGLEEEIVYSANEIYNLLERGSAKRRTAETLLNKQSSRSHSIFSITIHIKEATPEGEDLMKCGKLNLVDLAGSENISRSGARDGRAREAGEINKSLLTLGRVITALVEHLGHIPYRDSKLTRLLRDSLGGKTKTCIIATVSPSVHCLEETLSTLDYAHRAKNIKNKPEVNQKMMKSALIKDLYSEMERLKAEVNAAREKNGVYLPRERYQQEEAERKAMSERLEQMEFDMDVKNKRLDALQEELDLERFQIEELCGKLECNQKKLHQTQEMLSDTKDKLKDAQYTIKERDFIIGKFQNSEDALVRQAGSLQSQVESCVNEITALHSKIDRKSRVETDNQHTMQNFHGDLGQQLKTLHDSVLGSIKLEQQHLQDMQERIESFLASKQEATQALQQKATTLKDLFSSGLKRIHDLAHSHEKDSTTTFKKVNATISAHSHALEEVLSASVSQAEVLLQDFQTTLSRQEEAITSLISQQQEKAKINLNSIEEFSKELEGYYEMQEQSTSGIKEAVLDSNKTLHHTLNDLEEVYKEQSQQEEQNLLEKIAEMVTAVSMRKSEIVTSRIDVIRQSTVRTSEALQQDLKKMCQDRANSQSQWHGFKKEAECRFNQATSQLLSSQSNVESTIGHCNKTTLDARDLWKRAHGAVQQLESNNHLEVDLIVKEGVYGNGLLLTRLEEMNESIEFDAESCQSSLLESINGSFETDAGTTASMLTVVSFQGEVLTDLQARHENNTTAIKSEADMCFNNNYLEDMPTGVTPTKRPIDVLTKASIEALRAPSIDKLVQEFREEIHNTSSPEKGVATPKSFAMKESKIPIFADSSLLKDNRAPLAAVN
ncbi:hypothetical protein GOP47_0023523 [Adiantum capillus-veneris]|uniref:Kinesin motor domain-containing protein n=1 Tax=Adiantum capillus-veneris TaxID=13818 RepID=A0A9D4U3U8_ADICA|nr:hypothetical protein GOP47_0023523 [Adiantum capillus-veneris]